LNFTFLYGTVSLVKILHKTICDIIRVRTGCRRG
jgi:hypothetical protein